MSSKAALATLYDATTPDGPILMAAYQFGPLPLTFTSWNPPTAGHALVLVVIEQEPDGPSLVVPAGWLFISETVIQDIRSTSFYRLADGKPVMVTLVRGVSNEP